MNAGRTARERARAELTEEIKTAARQQLATVGAEALSLRAISRELGMVSSALYRYFASRDELLTALIIDAYDALGAAAEAAPSGGDPVDDWIAVYAAVRDWARANPQEYALIYGSPISGYQAPQTTVQPASRVPLLLLGLLQRAQASGRLVTPPDAPSPSGALAQQTEVLVALAPDVPPAVLVRTVIVWTQLFGMLSFELFGQLVGSMDPADEFFASASRQMAAFVGLS
ncbi:TetR family transcriptional regulator [Kribbella sp. VKM Ac-2569]|uniref:TetR/AcrR family transcriptional regulator n=1 Tax=Kribbella sp. VKM Ac-2569 TaxID=2512220 RepID=UPI00102BB835|nr:TetR/AcrR family transcriptional regulator [Kribbella sp. VKM Ac-2569]RZT14911.1 TetR family transcriptional regulator [Kribbella sp. VKM Ac-2569]